MTKMIALAGASGLLFGAMVAMPAAAIVPANQIFYFQGTCTDCNGIANAELVLAYNYSLGSAITTDNFISFHYDGTNLIKGGYTISSSNVSYVNGSMTSSSPAAETFTVSGNGHLFNSYGTGAWNSDIPVADFGTNGQFSATPFAASAPEPAAWGMMVVGFGLLGAALRRRPAKVVFA